MDTRTKNRFHEHVVLHRKEGHTFEITNVLSFKQPGLRLFRCSCSWSGWLSKNDLIELGWTE